MRGALPDSECPRCQATAPPRFDGRLVTCAGCGLVYEAREPVAQVRRRRPAAADGRAAPSIERLDVRTTLVLTDDRMEIAQRTDARGLAVLFGAFALTPLSPFVAAGAVAAAAVLATVNRLTLVVEEGAATVRERPLPLRNDLRVPLSSVTTFTLAPRSATHVDLFAQLRGGGSRPLCRALPAEPAPAILRWLLQRLAIAPAVG